MVIGCDYISISSFKGDSDPYLCRKSRVEPRLRIVPVAMLTRHRGVVHTTIDVHRTLIVHPLAVFLHQGDAVIEGGIFWDSAAVVGSIA